MEVLWIGCTRPATGELVRLTVLLPVLLSTGRRSSTHHHPNAQVHHQPAAGPPPVRRGCSPPIARERPQE